MLECDPFARRRAGDRDGGGMRPCRRAYPTAPTRSGQDDRREYGRRAPQGSSPLHAMPGTTQRRRIWFDMASAHCITVRQKRSRHARTVRFVRILVLGAGAVGGAILRAAAESEVFSAVVAGDVDATRAATAVERCDDARFAACAI